jgi:protein ImuB
MLARLPVEGLRLPPNVLGLLRECGLQTVGQTALLPRDALPSRFGPQLLTRLDQLLGQASEYLTPEHPPRPVRVEREFEEPLSAAEHVMLVVREMLEMVMLQLEHTCRFTQCVRVDWRLEQGASGEWTVRTLRATHRVERVWELLTLALERVELPGGVTRLAIEAVPCRPEEARRATLFDSDEDREGRFVGLIERLRSRLGDAAVHRCVLQPESQPELSYTREPWTDARPQESSGDCPRLPQRPSRMLSPPIPTVLRDRPLRFQWLGEEQPISIWEGPERVVTGWWRSPPCSRDYYRLETESGQRFWLFRQRETSQWFVHGLFE